MPTPEEIKKIAEQYADKECEQSSLEDKELLQLHEDKILEFYDVWGFLIESFCIVPKSHVRMAHKMEMQACESTDKTSACIFRQRALLIEAIFGKELFNEEEE